MQFGKSMASKICFTLMWTCMRPCMCAGCKTLFTWVPCDVDFESFGLVLAGTSILSSHPCCKYQWQVLRTPFETFLAFWLCSHPRQFGPWTFLKSSTRISNSKYLFFRWALFGKRQRFNPLPLRVVRLVKISLFCVLSNQNDSFCV